MDNRLGLVDMELNELYNIYTKFLNNIEELWRSL